MPASPAPDRELPLLLDLAQDPMVIASLDGGVRWANEAWTTLLGWKPEEVGSVPFLDIVHPDDRERTAAELGSVLRSPRETTRFVHRIQHRDGTYRTIDWAAVLPPGSNVVFAAGRDLTDRVDAEDRLRRSEAQLLDLFDSMSDLVQSVSPDGRFLFVNRAWREALGYDETEASTITLSDVLHDDGRADCLALFSRILAGEDPGPIRVVLRARDGRAVVVEGRPTLRAQDGVPLYTRTVFRDVSEREARIRELHAAQQSVIRVFQQIIEGSPFAIVAVDGDGNIQLANTEACRIFGYETADLVGRPVELLVPEAQRSGHRTLRDQYLALPEVRRMGSGRDLFGRHRDGHRIPLEASLNTIESAEGTMVLAAITDITERKRAMDAIITSQAEAERANLAKSEFLSRMSHELRTPLNAIMGFAQLLELEGLPERQLESVRHIHRAGRHLLGLINEVLDISRIESGQMTLETESVEVQELLDEVIGLFTALARDRRIAIETIRPSASVRLQADRQRLQQVLINLLSNAVKYNRDGGGVVVTLEATEAVVRVSIADTGPGIAAERMPQLFQPFERLGAEATDIDGTGLGLALSKGIVESMGGVIGVDSQVDRGSSFWVELPILVGGSDRVRPIGPAPTAPSGAAPSGGGRVLCIEDNEANLELIRRVVALRPGTELVAASRGEAGVNLARRHRPDLILLDMHLPDTSGRDVLRRLKAHPVTRDVPVLVVSADASPDGQQALVDAGAAGYLTKPLDLAVLLRLMDGILAKGSTTRG